MWELAWRLAGKEISSRGSPVPLAGRVKGLGTHLKGLPSGNGGPRRGASCPGKLTKPQR